jgi:Ca2+-binding EF-hand superfamily protein
MSGRADKPQRIFPRRQEIWMRRVMVVSTMILLVLAAQGSGQTKDDKALKKKGGLGNTPDEMVANLLKQMDTDRDGKISRAEAKGKLAESFDKIDANKDGYLDRQELRAMAQRILATQGGGPFPNAGPDFDALDKNADGRLTPDELKGTPWAARFAEIDADGNGYIDRREFETYLRKQRK